MFVEIDKEKKVIVRTSSNKIESDNIVLELDEDVPADQLVLKWEKDKPLIEITNRSINNLEKKKKQLSNIAKKYIEKILKQLDWGDTYEECLSELQNTAISTETKILYFLKPKIPNLTLTQIRENIALYIAGQKTKEEIIQELTQAGLTQEEINQYFELLTSAVEVAKLINWIEQVWKEEEKLEQEIEKGNFNEKILYADEIDLKNMNPFSSL